MEEERKKISRKRENYFCTMALQQENGSDAVCSSSKAPLNDMQNNFVNKQHRRFLPVMERLIMPMGVYYREMTRGTSPQGSINYLYTSTSAEHRLT